MKKSIDIYAYLEDNAKLWKILDESYNYTKIENYEEFLSVVSKTRRDGMYLYIIDIAKLKGKKFSHFENDLLNNKHLFVSAYGENIPQAIKSKLHTLEIRGVIENSSKNQKKLLDYIVTQANLHMRTLDNRFVKAFLNYHNLNKIEKKIDYILSFLSYRYGISALDISDIHLVFLSLFIAFEIDDVSKVSRTLHMMIQSPYIDKLYNAYTHPKNFKESIIVILLKLFEDKKIKKYLCKVNMQDIDKTLIETIQDIYNSRSIIIVSHQDINYFWEQLEMDMLEKCKDTDSTGILDDCIIIICNLLIYALARVDYIKVYTHMDFLLMQMSVHIELFGATNSILTEYIKSKILPTNRLTVQMEKENKIVLNLKSTNLENKTSNSYQKPTIDKSIISDMHYKDEEKISAKEFVKEFEVEQYLLDDLNDFETEIKDRLYAQDSLSQEILSAISNTLDGYERILNETIEFKDIAYSLQSLSLVFKNLSLDTLERAKKSTLRFYIQGLIDDLSSWKRYIFIEPNTPDIHYLDASLLENCATIERFISSDLKDETVEDDDLEFF